ncbi:uncharacterized protein A4U43_C03F21850 [Asparagus officinalis]|uniref:Uncharacterized protein n=1 Tax=Asparagus officinalis TaxID=4686 RepID=A0A5P1FH44_ASPOF|nr:uncharacterized protein A4U43_C03F21850 [Asparagus officinalis]
MGRKLRSSIQSTADEFLTSVPAQFSTKQGKSSLKTLISTISPSSHLISTLPRSLHLFVSQTLDSFKKSLHSQDVASRSPARASVSPPSKRARRSSRRNSSDEPSNTLDHLKKLQCYTFIAHQMISHPKKPFLASELLPSVQLLHDSLVLYEMDPVLLHLVASLCEEWWKEKLLDREKLVPQSLPFFLSKSLSNGKKSDVRRVYALREAFLLFDYVDESIEDMRLLLVRCVIAPVYLKTDEGRKFIAFMLGLNDQLAKEALALIKSQIPFGRKSVLEAYGDILFRSWKGCEGFLRDEIEDGFVQGLIDAAVHASSKSLAASIRRVLGGFIEKRATEGVEKLLFRLSEPLLFRSLQAANSDVRQNALHLFLDLFPLEDPEVTKEVKDTLLDKQFFLLEKLLLDDCPDVRAVAVEGCCRILNLFWEVIPSSIITKILKKIIDCMSTDACNEVRLSTVNGIIYLLENPQSHEIMKVLLPRLGCMLSDPTLSVRLAVTDLLLAIRDIRTFQFNKVVGLDALLSSLANDHLRVAQKITRLLIPSYFPAKMNLIEACGRCIALIKRSPTAGARFCELALSEGSSSKSLLELLRISVSLALSPKGLNSDQIDGLFVASANICCSLSSDLSNKKALGELFPSTKLKRLFTAAASPCAQTALFTLASVLSLDDLGGLRDLCIASIMDCTGLSENVEKQALIRAGHRFMLSYGWFDELFRALTNNLQSIASGFLNKFDLELPQQVAHRLQKIKTKMPVRTPERLGHFNGKETPNTDLSRTKDDLFIAAVAAWQLKDLLVSEDARNSLLKSPNLEITYFALRIISQVSIDLCSHCELVDTSAVTAYIALAMHMSLHHADTTSGDDNNNVQCVSMPSKLTIMEDSLGHLLNCAEKLFTELVDGKSSSLPSSSKQKRSTERRHKRKHKEALSSASGPTEGGEAKTDLPAVKVMQNVAKMATAILKIIADAAAVGLITHNHVKCLNFGSAFARYIVSFTRGQQNETSAFEEEDLKDVLVFLKSSFSYASKLLHLVLKNSSESSAPPREVFDLANDLLDLIVSIESSLGSKYASHILSVAKPWLPILVLALGSQQLIKAREYQGTASSGDLTVLPAYTSSNTAVMRREKSRVKRRVIMFPNTRLQHSESLRSK